MELTIQESGDGVADLRGLAVAHSVPSRPSRSDSHVPWDGRNADRSWEALLARAGSQRQTSRSLPYRIGITDRPDGGWHDYVHFEPLFDLPGFLNDLVPGAVSKSSLDRYRRAHHVSGFYGLLIDRLADGQVRLDAALRTELRWLRRAWEESLAVATGKSTAARRWIAPAMASWRAGLRKEKELLRQGHMEPEDYREIVVSKCSYLFVAAEAMLERLGLPPQTQAIVREVLALILLGLQCFDDASDAEEDARLAGAAAPALLGVRASALRRVGVHVMDRATELAAGNWARMAEWCSEVSQRMALTVPPGEEVLAELGAMILVPGVLATRQKTWDAL